MERNRVRKEALFAVGATGGLGDDISISELADMCAKSNFVTRCDISGSAIVIPMQTPTMISELAKNNFSKGEAINGIVSDAAHGFWQDRNHLLIVSSSYSTTLRCWVPALMSYSNGATAEHYCAHFLALFESIQREMQRRGIPLSDKHFAMVRGSLITSR